MSTKTTDRALAKKITERLQEAEEKARDRCLVESHARKLLNEILERVGAEKLSTETAEDFLRQWSGSKTNPRTANRYAHTVGLLLRSLGKKAKAVLTAITHQDILVFIEGRQRQGAASKTISIDVKSLNTAFNLARRLGHIQSNPVEKALALCPIEVESSEKECFRPGQVAALLKTATGDWKTVILMGYYTGARLGDCANMSWESINLTDRMIDYSPQKTQRKNKRVVVPMHPELLAHLEELAAIEKILPFLCPSLAERGSGGKCGLSEGFKSIMRNAGVDAQMVPGKGTRRFSKLSFHSLRHSFNSALANSGVDQEIRMKLTGHSSVAINSDYTHLDLPKLRAAVEKLPWVA